MTLTKTPICNFGKKAKDFNLLSTEKEKITLEMVKGNNSVCSQHTTKILKKSKKRFG